MASSNFNLLPVEVMCRVVKLIAADCSCSELVQLRAVSRRFCTVVHTVGILAEVDLSQKKITDCSLTVIASLIKAWWKMPETDFGGVLSMFISVHDRQLSVRPPFT